MNLRVRRLAAHAVDHLHDRSVVRGLEIKLRELAPGEQSPFRGAVELRLAEIVQREPAKPELLEGTAEKVRGLPGDAHDRPLFGVGRLGVVADRLLEADGGLVETARDERLQALDLGIGRSRYGHRAKQCHHGPEGNAAHKARDLSGGTTRCHLSRDVVALVAFLSE